jgi:hypothetical protein
MVASQGLRPKKQELVKARDDLENFLSEVAMVYPLHSLLIADQNETRSHEDISGGVDN